jgi:hypothetical protein
MGMFEERLGAIRSNVPAGCRVTAESASGGAARTQDQDKRLCDQESPRRQGMPVVAGRTNGPQFLNYGSRRVIINMNEARVKDAGPKTMRKILYGYGFDFSHMECIEITARFLGFDKLAALRAPWVAAA